MLCSLLDMVCPPWPMCTAGIQMLMGSWALLRRRTREQQEQQQHQRPKGAHWGSPSALLAYELARSLNLDDMHLLW